MVEVEDFTRSTCHLDILNLEVQESSCSMGQDFNPREWKIVGQFPVLVSGLTILRHNASMNYWKTELLETVFTRELNNIPFS